MHGVTFRQVTVFDGDGFLPPCDVVVADGLVRAVGERGDEGRVVDGRGHTLYPGFIDAHVHIGFYEPKVLLSNGLTTVRDLAWPPDVIFPLARRSRNDPESGPLVIAAGPMLTAPGGYPTKSDWAPAGTGIEVDSPDEAIAAVELVHSMGACIVKVAQEPAAGPLLSPETLGSIVAAAHGAGLRVVSHCGTVDQLEIAVAAKVDELAHGVRSGEIVPPDLVDRMVAQGMTVVPTLHIDPSPSHIDNIRRFVEAGGSVVYGTDIGNTGPPPGIDVSELGLMLEAGLGLETVIASATASAADHLGLRSRGRIAPGYVADVVLVEGDGWKDLARPKLVLREGRPIGG